MTEPVQELGPKPILSLKTFKTLDRNNAYFRFIEECRKKKYPEDTSQMHIHHIIPKYVFAKNASPEDRLFRDSRDNLIILSVADHAKAHALLFEIYGNPQDNGAVLMLNGYDQESRQIWRKLGAQAVNKLMQEQQKTFWDPAFQKEMGARSMARPDARAIRAAGGKAGGTKTKQNIAIKKHQKYVFLFKGEPVLCIINCDSGTQVLQQLQLFQKTPLQRTTQLLKGERKSLYGWSCAKLNDNGSPVVAA